MRVLFDHNVDRRFRRHLVGHEIRTTREMRWERLANGELLKSATDAGFEAFLSIDKNIRHEQNLDTLPIAVLILDSISNALPALIPFTPFVLELFEEQVEKALYLIAPDGKIVRLGRPRGP